MKVIPENTHCDDLSLEQTMRVQYWQSRILGLIYMAASDGIVITVATQSKQPPAMGNYDLIVSARVKRGS